MAALAGGLPAAVYTTTMARGLVWGDGPELIAVAASLGVAHPTGYPLFTILGHLACRLPGDSPSWGSPALRVTFLCALLMAGACLALYSVLLRSGSEESGPEAPAIAGLFPRAFALAGTLCFAWAAGPWSHGTRVEVYGLQVLLQTSIAAAFLGYLKAPSPGWLALLFLLGGSAVGHHLLGAMLAPVLGVALVLAARGWPSVTVRAPDRAPPAGTAGRGEAGLGRACAFFVLGLAPLLYVPARAAALRAEGWPTLSFGDPSTLARWLWTLGGGDYLRTYLGQAGADSTGASTDPAGAPWLVARRITLLGRFVAEQVAPGSAGAGFWPAICLGIAILLALGWRRLARSRPAFAYAWAGTTVLYLVVVLAYGIRDIADYQLGLWAWLWPVAWHGLGTLASAPWTKAAAGVAGRRRGPVLLFALPLLLLIANGPRQDRSHHRVPDRYAHALLDGLPSGAVLVTEGDVATATAWYLRHGDPRHPELEVVVVDLLPGDWYARQLRRRGLWDGPLPSELGPRRSDRVHLLWHGVLAPRAGRRPIALVVSPATRAAVAEPARRAGLRLGGATDLLASDDVVEVVASGVSLPPLERVRLVGRRAEIDDGPGSWDALWGRGRPPAGPNGDGFGIPISTRPHHPARPAHPAVRGTPTTGDSRWPPRKRSPLSPRAPPFASR